MSATNPQAQSAAPTEFGSVNYDVSDKNRAAYSKLRRLFRRKAIMQTFSSYLFPWGMAQQISEGIDRINKDKDGSPLPSYMQVRFSLFKYDTVVSGQAIAQSANDGIMRMLINMKEQVNKKVQSLFDETAQLENDADPERTARAACRKASGLLQDARALALMFNLSDNMDAAFLAYEAFIETKKSDIKSWADAAAQTELLQQSTNVTTT